MSEKHEELGRIEVAPEVLVDIARVAAMEVEGVSSMATSSERGRPFRRNAKTNEGIVLEMSEAQKLRFDLFVNMDPHVSIMDTSKRLQLAIVEAMDKMVGVEVESVNVHVEDVVYGQGDAA